MAIMRRAMLFIVFLTCVLAVTIVYVPRAEAALIGTKDEISIGRDVAKQLEKQYGLVTDEALQARVNRIGMRMVAISERTDLPYTFKVLNSKEVNALACPGGFIYVFKGLVDLMPSDDELAGVLGHEIGHVVKRHSVHQLEKNLGMSILFNVVFGNRGVLLQNLALNAIMAGYSRADEREADNLGFVHSYRAGFNPYSMKMGLEKLSTLDQKYHYDLFSDHPEARSRVATVQQYIDAAGVKPHVRQVGNKAQVFEGDWQVPTVATALGGYKPLYRAYFVAGNLYRVYRLPDYSAERFILYQDGDNIIIYYDERSIITITPQEASAQGVGVMELANTWIEQLRQWKGK